MQSTGVYWKPLWNVLEKSLSLVLARMEDALRSQARTTETGRLKDRNKMERRLGRVQATHPQLNDLYEIVLRDTAEGVRLHWAIKEDRKLWRGLRKGAYMLRTNLPAGTAEELGPSICS